MQIGDRTSIVRMRLVSALALVGAGFILLNFRKDIEYGFHFNSTFLLVIGLSALMTGIAILLLLYLKGDIRITQFDRLIEIPERTGSFSDAERELREELNALKDQLTRAAVGGGGSEADREALVEALRAELPKSVSDDLERRFAANAVEQFHIAYIRRSLEGSALRLRAEIAALSRRGNLNLVIGTLTTAMAVSLLAYMVLNAEVKFTDLSSLLSHYIPRVTTVAFIEVFSFFFLKLYRSSLADIRFYQNELTNLSLHGVALETALLSKEPGAYSVVAEYLLKVDRNASMPTNDGKSRGAKEVADSLAATSKSLAEIAQKLT
jgi:hypothetical protein